MDTEAKPELTSGHLFAGGGGDTGGVIKAGFTPLWAVENDKYAASIFRYRFPSCRLLEQDIRTITDVEIKTLPTPTVVVITSPCQDFSTAGLRRGIEGDRGKLVWQAFRFLELLRPEYVIFENVKGIVSSNNGKDFQAIRDKFDSLQYLTQYYVRNGNRYVPQNRERVFIVGRLLGQRSNWSDVSKREGRSLLLHQQPNSAELG